MKKIFISLLAISVLTLSGCFGFSKDDALRSAADTTVPMQTVPQGEPSTNQNGQAEFPEPPSFQDGDYYLQALAARSQAVCEKIKNEDLKIRCTTDVKELEKE